MDRKKVVKDNAIHGLQSAIEISGALVHLRKEHAKAILKLLKKQEEQIDTQRKNLIILLNKQEAVKSRRDANYVRMFRCGTCGEYVGFIDSDPGDPNEQDNYCRNCGRPVKW